MNRVLVCVCLVAIFAHASLQSPFLLDGLGIGGGGGIGGIGGIGGGDCPLGIFNPLCWPGEVAQIFTSFTSALAKVGIDASTFFVNGFFGRNHNGDIVYVKDNTQVKVPVEVYVQLSKGSNAQDLPPVESEGYDVIEVNV